MIRITEAQTDPRIAGWPSIHEKLGVRDRTEAVMTALRQGILQL